MDAFCFQPRPRGIQRSVAGPICSLPMRSEQTTPGNDDVPKRPTSETRFGGWGGCQICADVRCAFFFAFFLEVKPPIEGIWEPSHSSATGEYGKGTCTRVGDMETCAQRPQSSTNRSLAHGGLIMQFWRPAPHPTSNNSRTQHNQKKLPGPKWVVNGHPLTS